MSSKIKRTQEHIDSEIRISNLQVKILNIITNDESLKDISDTEVLVALSELTRGLLKESLKSELEE